MKNLNNKDKFYKLSLIFTILSIIFIGNILFSILGVIFSLLSNHKKSHILFIVGLITLIISIVLIAIFTYLYFIGYLHGIK